MNHSGTFIRTLDLGTLGEHDAVVAYAAYTTTTPAVDDYDEMDIETVYIDFRGMLVDVLYLLDVEELKVAAWDEVPTADDIGSDRADAYNDERRAA